MRNDRLDVHRIAILATGTHARRWIADGWRIARHGHDALLESITTKHEAESRAAAAVVERLKARGRPSTNAPPWKRTSSPPS